MVDASVNSSEFPSPSVPRVVWSILVSLARTRRPRPQGMDTVDHGAFGAILSELAADAASQLPDHVDDLADYLGQMQTVTPDELTRDDALAYWMNVYNAAALQLGARAFVEGKTSVLGVPGGFSETVVRVGGESLSLDDIEHGKLRRFRDPRIHAGLVCGSISCPTLRREPFGGDVQGQLDDQMHQFLRGGGLRLDTAANRVVLSPVFSWFGRDFVQPHRMPTLMPARRADVLVSVSQRASRSEAEWILGHSPQVTFSHYDWRLGCAVG